MTEQKQRDWKYYLLGAVSGIGVGGGVVGLVVKHIYEKKLRKTVTKAQMNGEKVPVVPKPEELCDRKIAKTVTYPDGRTENYNKDGILLSGTYHFGEKTVTNGHVWDVKIGDDGHIVGISRETGQIVESYDPAALEHPTEDDPDIDLDNMDVGIDDLDAYDKTEEERQAYNRYYDLTEQYLGGEGIKTRIIGPEDYIGDYRYEKSAVNWYEDDDVFEEDLNTIDDPFATFGVTHGKQLFEKAENREDPDIVYVRNENQTVDYEISRIHGSYAQKVGGERSLGETDS